MKAKKVALIYTSLSGNTKDTAEIIRTFFHKSGVNCDLFSAEKCQASLSDYDLVILGTYTWGDGALPMQMAKTLQEMVANLSSVALFGTGDSAYYYYCGAIDKMAQFLTAKAVKVNPHFLKIEQSPFALNQRVKIIRWATLIMQNLEEQYATKNTLTYTRKSELCDSHY